MNAKLERVNKLECKADAEFDFIVVVGAVGLILLQRFVLQQSILKPVNVPDTQPG